MKFKKVLIFLFITVLLWIGVFLVFRGNYEEEVGVDEIFEKSEKIDEIKKQEEEVINKKVYEPVLFDVPFISQAPFGNWDDIRYQDGCEEAASIMAIKWVRGESLTAAKANDLIADISKYELEKFGYFHDTSAKDTAERILKGYFGYEKIEVKYDIGTKDIKEELYKGNLVIIPTNGRKLKNPYYTPPGPERHMLPVIGYDSAADEFITNDNGTKRGKGYRYKAAVLEEAIQDYPSGHKVPISSRRTAMIVIKKL